MKAIRRLVLLLVVVALTLRATDVELHSSLLWVAAGAETCIVALVLYGLVRVWRARTTKKDPHGWDALRSVLQESLPEGVTEAALSEARILVAAARSICRRPLQPVADTPGFLRFGAMETSSYSHTVTMLLLLIVLEAPAVHAILGSVMEEGTLRGVIRGGLLGSSIYLAVWLIGDLRLLRETPGVQLGDRGVDIELGLRVNGSVALAKVTGAELLKGQQPKRGHGKRAIRISPQPRPNCRIQLRSPVTLRGVFGVPLRGEALDVYVDDPAGLVSSIQSAIALAGR